MLDYIKSEILKMKFPNVSNDSFGELNLAYDIQGKDLFFELYLNEISSRPFTEIETVSKMLAGVVVSVPFDEGRKRIERIVECVVDTFSTVNPNKRDGRFDVKPIFNSPFYNKKLISHRITSVETSTGKVVDGRYKQAVFLRIDKRERFIRNEFHDD